MSIGRHIVTHEDWDYVEAVYLMGANTYVKRFNSTIGAEEWLQGFNSTPVKSNNPQYHATIYKGKGKK